MAVLDLSDDKLEPYGFGSEPVGFAVSDEDEVSYALLLLKDYELLTKVNISDFAQPETVSLPAAPTGLGAMPGGGFYITHDASLGLISFYDPADDSFTLSSGFAAIGIFLDDTLPRTGAEE